jgi:membrane-associated protease RseP (regulator of RpoE activity)
LINSVAENSAAAKAGLKAGDVIVEVDGKAVAGNLDLTRAINEKKEGEITLTIIRNKNRQTVRLTPEKAKDNGLFEIYRQENGTSAPLVQPRNQFRVITPSRPQGFRVQIAPRSL